MGREMEKKQRQNICDARKKLGELLALGWWADSEPPGSRIGPPLSAAILKVVNAVMLVSGLHSAEMHMNKKGRRTMDRHYCNEHAVYAAEAGSKVGEHTSEEPSLRDDGTWITLNRDAYGRDRLTNDGPALLLYAYC
jgi:hypothetical protein